MNISDVMKMKRRRDIEGLISALKDADLAVRAEAASSLGSLRDAQAVEALIATLENDNDPYVRSLSATALGAIGDAKAGSALLNALENDTSLEVGVAAGDALKNVASR